MNLEHQGLDHLTIGVPSTAGALKHSRDVLVWQLGAEARVPGHGDVVFPGNVGIDNALADLVRLLRTV